MRNRYCKTLCRAGRTVRAQLPITTKYGNRAATALLPDVLVGTNDVDGKLYTALTKAKVSDCHLTRRRRSRERGSGLGFTSKNEKFHTFHVTRDKFSLFQAS